MISADGLCGINREQRIVLWNEAATRLLGHTISEVRGRLCFDILGGLDESGCRVCQHGCPLFAGAKRNTPLPARDVLVRSKSGRQIWLELFNLVLPPAGQDITLLHLFRDVTRQKMLLLGVQSLLENHKSCPARIGQPQRASAPLTPREQEVLRLLAAGASTRQMAETLTVSAATVRRHVENLLTKLHVHSRLEAVSLAYSQELLS